MPLPISSILINREALQNRVTAIAQAINRDYAGEEVVLVACLKGAVFFLTDLMKELTLDVEMGFLYLSSYKGEVRPQGDVQHYILPFPKVEGRHVILVEDILDTGNSIRFAWDHCQAKNPKTLKTCILLVKEGSEQSNLPPVHYRGFDIPNEFVVGYGLDCQERFRQLPYIAIPDLKALEMEKRLMGAPSTCDRPFSDK